MSGQFEVNDRVSIWRESLVLGGQEFVEYGTVVDVQGREVYVKWDRRSQVEVYRAWELATDPPWQLVHDVQA